MREHEAGELERKGPAQRAATAAPEHHLLALQRAAGNAAVAQHVQRADVEIDEMTSNINVRDDARLNKDVRTEVEHAVHRPGVTGGGEGEESSQAQEPPAPAAAEQEQAAGGGGLDDESYF